MTAEDIIFKMIQGNAPLKELVGDRVYPEVAPGELTEDHLVYQRMNSNDATSHQGFDDLTEPVYQITFWSADARTRKLARQLLLNLFRLNRSVVDGTTVVHSTLDDRDLTDDGPPRFHGASVDVQISG